MWWRSFWAGTVFLVGIFAVSAWSGAQFTFDIFLLRYKHPRRPRPSVTPSAGVAAAAAQDAGSPVLSSARKRA